MTKNNRGFHRSVLSLAVAMTLMTAFLSFPQYSENKIIENKMTRKTARWFSRNVDTIILKTYSSYLRSNNRYYPKVEDLVIHLLQKKGYNVRLAGEFWTEKVETPLGGGRNRVEFLLKSRKVIPANSAYLDFWTSFWNFRPFKTYSYWKETYRLTNEWGNTVAKIKEPFTSRKYYMVGAVKSEVNLYFGIRSRPKYNKYVHIEKKAGYSVKKAVKLALSGIPKRKK